jgi:hypothetical protein
MSLSWGVVLADLDSDGDEDLVIANGHIYPQVDAHPEFGMTYRQRNQILENTGGGRFRDVTASAGPGFQIALPSRAIAAGDYDDDGDVDLLVTNLDAPPSLLRNDGPQGHRLTVILDAARGAGPAIGSRVTVKAGGLTLVREAASSGSFMSSHDPRMHFGLGQASKADSVEVRWPDGSTTIRTEIPADGVVRIPRGAMNPGAVRP